MINGLIANFQTNFLSKTMFPAKTMPLNIFVLNLIISPALTWKQAKLETHTKRPHRLCFRVARRLPMLVRRANFRTKSQSRSQLGCNKKPRDALRSLHAHLKALGCKKIELLATLCARQRIHLLRAESIK
jgi:hypothetical protein